MLSVFVSMNASILIFSSSFASARMLTGATAALFLLAKGLELKDLALIKSVQFLAYILSDIPFGYYADKSGRKRAVLLSCLLASAWLWLTGYSKSLSLLMVAEALNGVSLALLKGALEAYLIDFDQNRTFSKRKVLSSYHRLSHLMMAVAAFLGALFYSPHQAYTWYFASGLCLIIFVMGILHLPEDRRFASASAQRKSKRAEVRQDLIQCVRGLIKPSVSSIFILSIPLFVFYQLFINFWQPFIEDAFMKYKDVGVFWGILYLVILMSQAFASWISESISSHKTLLIMSLGLMLVITALMCFTHYLGPNIVIAVGVVVFMQLRMSSLVVMGLWHDQISNDLRATMDSVISTLLRVLVFGAMALIGLLAENVWHPLYALYMCLILAHMGFVLHRFR